MPPKGWPKALPPKLERANVLLPNLEFMNAEFNPLLPSRALADVDARDAETAEALPRGFVAAAPAVALRFEFAAL